MSALRAGVLVGACLLGLHATAVSQGVPVITHGVASGDVTADSVVLWSRADRDATMRARIVSDTGDTGTHEASTRAVAASDYTAHARVTGLTPATAYRYEIWFEDGDARSARDAGAFRTAAGPETLTPVTFIWGGDLAGQGYCRRPVEGYRIFRSMLEARPDFFVANGDMIYGDNACAEVGPVPGWINIPGGFPAVNDPSVDWRDRARVEEIYRAHWRYNRADAAHQAFLRTVPMYAQWDDHEVINDFGAPWPAYPASPDRPGYPTLVAAGRQAFFDFNPIARHAIEPDRIYRSYRWGRGVELFILDARSYRSDNRAEDTEANAKTMLGREQLEWLRAGLIGSMATWKIVSADVPLAAPTGSEAVGRDAFASQSRSEASARTGFERELLDLLRSLDARDVRNVVFVTTDVHYAAQLRYERDLDGDGDTLLFHELISGPLSAVRSATPTIFDPTLGPAVLYAEGSLFNYGTVRLDHSARGYTLRTDIRDEDGRPRAGSELEIAPQPAPIRDVGSYRTAGPRMSRR